MRATTKTILAVAMVLAATAARAQPPSGGSSPVVNSVTISGPVYDLLYWSFPGDGSLLGFRVSISATEFALVECHEDHPSGCEKLLPGDVVLVVGHLGFHQSCNMLGDLYNCVLIDQLDVCPAGVCSLLDRRARGDVKIQGVATRIEPFNLLGSPGCVLTLTKNANSAFPVRIYPAVAAASGACSPAVVGRTVAVEANLVTYFCADDFCEVSTPGQVVIEAVSAKVFRKAEAVAP